MTTTIVLPVYNEEKRLQPERFSHFVKENLDFRLLFVNDGSTDGTRALLEALARDLSGRISFIDQPKNAGKAEAVRCGVLRALSHRQSKYVGYLDADLSTPLGELPAFAAVLDKNPRVVMVLGSRVRLLGKNIQRRLIRHLLGRIFATVTSIILRIGVYDTQCGAKVMRASGPLEKVFAQPFMSKWVFDVEIIARMANVLGLSGGRLEQVLIEQPLDEWREVGGSKVKARDFVVAILEMKAIYFRYRSYLKPPVPDTLD